MVVVALFTACVAGCQLAPPSTINDSPFDFAEGISDSKQRDRQVQQASHQQIDVDITGVPPASEIPVDVPSLRLASSRKEPPKELAKMALPKYRLEPPDVLLIDVLRLVPKSPYVIQPFDILEVVAPGSDSEFPLADFFQVEPGGRVNLGASYGHCRRCR